MALLSLQNFNTLVQNFASSVQGTCASLLDFTPGSVLRAIGEACSSVALWIQNLILQVLALTRLATSTGTDVDTWIADFGLTRAQDAYATGTVRLSRFVSTSYATVQPGAQVKTGDGTQVFTVIADTTQSAWSVTQACYVIPSGNAYADVTVQAVNPGTQGNVQAGTISLLASAIPFVDTVTNSSNFNNGVDAASDAAVQVAFANYIQTRARATLNAIEYAISTVQQNITSSIAENVTATGTYQPGNFIVTVDDGTGTPPESLLDAVSLAVSTYRPIGSTWVVRAPTVTTATITFTISTFPAINKAALVPQVQAAVVAYVNAIADGSPLIYSRISGVAYAVDPSIISVDNVVLNGGSVDITQTAFGAIKASNASVTVS